MITIYDHDIDDEVKGLRGGAPPRPGSACGLLAGLGLRACRPCAGWVGAAPLLAALAGGRRAKRGHPDFQAVLR